MQLGHKGRSADAGQVVAGDNQAQIPGKLGLLYEAQRFCCIGDAQDV